MSLATRLLVVISFLCYKYENVNGSLDKYADILLLSTNISSVINNNVFGQQQIFLLFEQIFLCLPTNISLFANKYFFVNQQIFLCLPTNISLFTKKYFFGYQPSNSLHYIMLTDDYWLCTWVEGAIRGGEVDCPTLLWFLFSLFSISLLIVNRQIQKTYFLLKSEIVEREQDEERVVLCCDLSLTMRQEEERGRVCRGVSSQHNRRRHCGGLLMLIFSLS